MTKRLLEFEADWCGPCHAIKPQVEKLKEETGIEVERVDIDVNPELAESYNVQSIPTLIVVEDAKELARFVGLAPTKVLRVRLGL